MANENYRLRIKKASPLKTLAFLVAIVLIIAAVALVWHGLKTTGTNKPLNGNQQPAANSPDPVKEENGPNSDISPSPTGIGPGADASQLSDP